jgi:integrase
MDRSVIPCKVRVDNSSGVTKCWLSPDDLSRLERKAGQWDWEREIAVQLMGCCGLRASEASYPSDADLRWSEESDVWLFEIRSKNTKGGEPKIRDASMPEPVACDIHKFSREREFGPTDPWIDASTSSIRRWVTEAAERVADEEEAPRWRSVSSHDLRRSWATQHLVERQVDVRTVMSIGAILL